jgi:hypothetical protein
VSADVVTGTATDDEDYQKYLAWKNSKAGRKPAPDPIGADDLRAQIEKMQQQISALHASQGVPVDPIDASVKALVAHVQARKAANPQYDFSELEDMLTQLDKADGNPSVDEANLLRDTVEEHRERHGQISHEYAYINELSRQLRKQTLAEKVATDKRATAPVVDEEEEEEVSV